MGLCMCTGNCDRKMQCLRYMKKPHECYQTYSSLEEVCVKHDYAEFIPYVKKECDYTLDNFIMDELKKNKETN